MSMLKIENGYATIELSPFQCATLANACEFASQQSLDEEIDAWRSLAVLFQACTIAGFAQWQMSERDLETLLHQLSLLNSKGNGHGPNSKMNGHQP